MAGTFFRQRKINHQDPRAARDSLRKAGESGGRDGVPDPVASKASQPTVSILRAGVTKE
jgi:hypothetical protein